jgi:hypothetical protein
MSSTQQQSVLERITHRRIAALICAIAVAGLSGPVLAQAEVVMTDVTFSFNSACAGEVVTITGTLHTMQRPESPFPAISEHGNWSNATAVGLTSGNIYRFAGSPINYLAGPGVFMNNITLVGLGSDAATFTITRSAPTFFGPWDVIQEHCN